MAQYAISPFRRDPLCLIRPHRNPNVLVPDLASLHSLPKTLGTTAYNTGPLYGPYLRLCFFPFILLLQTRNLFRGDQGLL